MMKLKITYFLLGAIIIAPILAILLMSFRGIGEKPNSNYLAVEAAAKEIHCPDGAIIEYGPWGESGWMAKCQLAHGPFVAAEHGHIVVRSKYEMGKLVNDQ